MQPGLLGHTREGLRLKWQRLRAAAAGSSEWQAELGGAGVNPAQLAAAVCAPHSSLDRLAYLTSDGGLPQGVSLVQVRALFTRLAPVWAL